MKKSLKVMMVDDDTDMTEMCEMVLNRKGYEVVTVNDARTILMIETLGSKD